MTEVKRNKEGQFVSGTTGNPKGRPTKLEQLRKQFGPELESVGASPEQAEAIIRSGVNGKGLLALTCMLAAVDTMAPK